MKSDQKSFETWLWIEVLLIYGHMISAVLFTIVRRIMSCCNKDEYLITSKAHKFMGQSDFLVFWTNHLGIVALNVQPFVTLMGMRAMPVRIISEENERLTHKQLENIIILMCSLQSLVLLIGLFIRARDRKNNTLIECCSGKTVPLVKISLVYTS